MIKKCASSWLFTKTENMLVQMYQSMLIGESKPFIANISDYAPNSA